MAGGDISVAETGLRVAEIRAPGAGTMDSLIFDMASKSLSEGRAAKAAETLKNPGQTLTQQEAKDKIDLVFKKDSVNAAGNLTNSADQTNRSNEAKTISTIIIKCRETGYGTLSGPEKTMIRTTLSDALFNHQAIRTIAANKGVNLTSALFKSYCNDTAVKLLSNQQMGDKMTNQVVDILISANINYSALETDLETSKNLSEEVNNLTTEIGTASVVGGAAATGLEKEVEDQQKIVDKYKTEIRINAATGLPEVVPIAPGPDSKAEMLIGARKRMVDYDKQIKLFTNSVKDVDNYFKSHGAANDYTITDPETGNPGLVITRGDWAAKKTDWEDKAKDLEVKKAKDQSLIEKVDQEEKSEDTKLKDLKAKIEAKKVELKKQAKAQIELQKK